MIGEGQTLAWLSINCPFIRTYLGFTYFSRKQNPATTMAALLLDERKVSKSAGACILYISSNQRSFEGQDFAYIPVQIGRGGGRLLLLNPTGPRDPSSDGPISGREENWPFNTTSFSEKNTKLGNRWRHMAFHFCC